jgi:RNA polymerase sigma-70 factor, ECF subfamily
MGAEFDEFFAANYASTVRTLAAALNDWHLAENAAQEGFVRALARWRKVSTMHRPAAWVYVVAVRSAWRSSRARPDAEPSRILNDEAHQVVERVVMSEALSRLTARQRVAVLLRYRGDLSIEEIADAMGCAPGTVKATLHQALARLRVGLSETDAAEEAVIGST